MPSFLLETPDHKLERIMADQKWRATIPYPTDEERDREIYEAVYIQHRKPFKVAHDWRLTPQTVINIARQTRDKLARREHALDKLFKSDSLKAFYDELFDQQRELRESWEASKEGQTTLMVTANGREPMRETIRNKGIGDVRLMRLMNQISHQMQRIEARFAVDDMPVAQAARLCESEAEEAEELRKGGAEEAPQVEAPLAAQPLTPGPSPPRGEGRTEKRPSRRRRIGRRRGGLRDTFTSLPEGVSTGSEELDRQHLAAINGLPFPAEPCGCGDGGP